VTGSLRALVAFINSTFQALDAASILRFRQSQHRTDPVESSLIALRSARFHGSLTSASYTRLKRLAGAGVVDRFHYCSVPRFLTAFFVNIGNELQNRLMTEYAGYFDASGRPDDKPFVVVAGFIATEKQWLEFEQPWREALRTYNLGQAFHMTDFQSQKRDDKGKVLDRLTDIIIAHTTANLSCSVEMAAYKKYNDIYALEERVGTPYAIAARGAAMTINRWKAECFVPEDKLLLFVEEGTKHHGDMEEAFQRDSLPIPQKVPKNHPSVQPADLLAWEVHQYVRHFDNRRSMLKLVRHGSQFPDKYGEYRGKDILRMCQAAEVPLRASLAPGAVQVFHSSPNRPRKRTIR